MKKIIFTITLLATSLGFTASGSMFDGMSKEELGEYEITITNKKTGKVVGKMSRAEYKVVKIGEPGEEPKVMVTKQEAKIVEKYKNGYGTIILHGGVGNDGLTTQYHNSQWQVSERERAVGGVTGCYSEKNTGVCATGLTNRTFLMGLKLDF